MNFVWLLSVASLLVFAGACESSETNSKKNAKTFVGGERKMDTESQITEAKKKLSERLSVAKSEIEVLSSTSVTWRSGALGCPEPGKVYTQALVPGRVIVLGVKDKVYRYHSDLTGQPFFCPSHRVESKKIDPSDL